MKVELPQQDQQQAIFSLKTYFAEELEMDLSDLRARLLLDFFFKEFGPFAYNQGVKDAESFLRRHLEDLPGSCFEHPLSSR